jgi:hypothetical protein
MFSSVFININEGYILKSPDTAGAHLGADVAFIDGAQAFSEEIIVPHVAIIVLRRTPIGLS